MDQEIKSNTSPAIKSGWLRGILFLISSLIVSTITSALGLLFIIISFKNEYDLSLMLEQPSEIMEFFGPINMIVITFSQFLGMFLVLWLFRKFIDKKSIKSLGFELKFFKRNFILGLFYGAGLILIGFLILYFFGFIKVIAIQFSVLDLFSYLIIFTLVSLYEEIMIRGYMLNNFMSSMNKYFALIVTSFCFMIIHLMNANISIIGMINLFLAGLLLGIFYIHKINLWFPIGMHLTWNFFQGPVCGYEVSGFHTQSIITQKIIGNPIITGGEFGFEGSILATVISIIMIVVIHRMAKQA